MLVKDYNFVWGAMLIDVSEEDYNFVLVKDYNFVWGAMLIDVSEGL